MTTEKSAEATPRPWSREQEAYDAGRLAGYEEGLAASEGRLLRVESAAREFTDSQDADTGDASADVLRIFNAVERLRAALDPTAAGEGR